MNTGLTMGSAPSLPSDKRIVVVGAGFGGALLAMELLKRRGNFLLIDCKDSFHQNQASVRAIVQPGFSEKTLVPLSKSFGDKFKQSTVESVDIDNKNVRLEDGEVISYDILVIATGSSGPFPFKLDTGNKSELVEQQEQIVAEVKKSDKILVVGGGATGVELAGEITTLYPTKEVTMITRGEVLVQPGLTAKFYKTLNGLLERSKIKVIYGDSVDVDPGMVGKSGEHVLRTRSGKEITTNLVLTCTGVSVNQAAYASALGDKMERNGAIMVDEFLRVVGCDDVYALGDCCNTREQKHAATARHQALYLGPALTNRLNNQKVKPYKVDGLSHRVVISYGPRHGIGELKNGWMLPEFVINSFKSKDLMTGQFWKELNQ